MILLDGPTTREMVQHLDATRDFSGSLAWVMERIQWALREFATVPDRSVLMAEASKTGENAPLFQATVADVWNTPITGEAYVKAHMLEWIRKNIIRSRIGSFQSAFTESGDAAVEVMDSILNEVKNVRWDAPDRSWFFQDLPTREKKRTRLEASSTGIPTGLPVIDHLFEGGIRKTELCAWIAYPKVGKSTVLINHGMRAVRAGYNVLHVILEDTRENLERRYEAHLTQTPFSQLRPGGGGLPPEVYDRAFNEYQNYRNRLVLQSFTGKGAVSVTTIRETLHDLRASHGWVPDLLVVDYADLLKGTGEAMWQQQITACRELKDLANEGYAVWTAFQANFDKKDADTDEHIVGYGQVAGGKEKIRIVDFVGSLNATAAERAAGRMRIAPLVYRSGQAEGSFMAQIRANTLTIVKAESPTEVEQRKLGYAT